jgi:hypothetical protein
MQWNIPASMLQTPEKVVLKAGTVIKVGGFPFRLLTDAEVEGHQINLDLTKSAAQVGVAQG